MIGLSAALERDHRMIDALIEQFTGDASSPSARAALIEGMQGLRRHIYLEEETLFPPLRAAGLMGPIMVMLREHAEMWQVLSQLDGLLAGAGGQAADHTELRSACGELLGLLEAHNPKEERILYPQADAILGPPETAAVSDFLDSGEMPEGWVCELQRSRTAG
jgi:hemerythrin-like domain-containing protein